MNQDLPHLLVFFVAISCLAGACTMNPGEPWGYLDTALTVHPLEDSASVTFSDQNVEIGTVQVFASSAGAGGVTDFDPANPPPGFSLCHNDHCHTDDGRIVTYDEIIAGAGAADESGNRLMSSLALNETASLTSPFSTNEMLRIVEQVSLNEASVTLTRLDFRAAVFDEQDNPVVLDISISLRTRPIQAPILIDVGRQSPEVQEMVLELALPSNLFEDLPELNEVLTGADGETITVHGTSNRRLADALAQRIEDRSTLIWVEP